MSAACPTNARMANASTQRDLTPVNATLATPSLGEACAKVTCVRAQAATHTGSSSHSRAVPARPICLLPWISWMSWALTKHILYFPLVKARKKTLLILWQTDCVCVHLRPYTLSFFHACTYCLSNIVLGTSHSDFYFSYFPLSRYRWVQRSQLLSQRRLRQHSRLLPVPGLRTRVQACRWKMCG